VYLDITHLGYDGIMKKLPTMHEQFLKLADIDISKEPMEVFPTIHYTMGGIKIDPKRARRTCRASTRPARSRAACTARTACGGNSLSDLLVFGRRAGEGAAEYVKGNVGSSEVEASEVEAEKRRVLAPLERKEDGENPYASSASSRRR
jgi:succinate dehydrogenase / fumarate reductase flavoprotein subunit